MDRRWGLPRIYRLLIKETAVEQPRSVNALHGGKNVLQNVRILLLRLREKAAQPFAHGARLVGTHARRNGYGPLLRVALRDFLGDINERSDEPKITRTEWVSAGRALSRPV